MVKSTEEAGGEAVGETDVATIGAEDAGEEIG